MCSSDLYAGSDTWVTSRILGRYLRQQSYDWILSGTHSLDGGTGHVPPQVAELLGIPQMSNIIEVDRDGLVSASTTVEVDGDEAVLRFAVDAPALLSVQYSTVRKLPYIAYEKINLDVRDQITVIDNQRLGFDETEVGLTGSLTKVVTAQAHKLERKDTLYVGCDDAGIEAVYDFLRDKGFLP